MSKYNREKHKNLISLIGEAAFAIARLIQEERVFEVPQLLADCQDAAVALGTHIEKLYGMQTQTVATLEQFCNALYQVSVDMDEASLIALAESIEQIQSVYNAEFPEKKEVVFMPYNASMWDSLESVWMAARDDESCEAYVVPIPYYDLDENRCFKEFHYEGDKFPEYVPITHYEDYDLELHHPDMIFIHNPYDECNLVTSIAPEFYSSKIKEFTDKLVYIPYFVLNEINPKNQVAIEQMKHFCLLPGVIHADYVIVQSEDMRQIYMNEYEKAVKAAGGKISCKELEEKFLGLGSPKFDKAVNTKKEDLDVPADWLRIIEKPDGTWKKIIFYNTSLGAFLNNSAQMLVKIKDTLRVFKENQDELALLWRPHPLMMQTIESMRPHLCETYKEIVQKYKEEGWGIYDDTTDMDRAVVLSDVYYGDQSSVLNVYQETGKPIMVQDISLYAEREDLLSSECLYDDGEYLWAVHTDFNGLFRIEKNELQVEFVGHIPDEPIVQDRLYTDIVECNDKLYLCPFNANEIAEYDKHNNTFKKIAFKENDIFIAKCFKVVAVEKCVYFIPYFYDSIICYNTEKEILSYINIYKEKISERQKSSNKGYFECNEIVNNKIILPYSCTNSLLLLDTSTNTSSLIEDIGYGNGFVGAVVANENLYLTNSSGEVIRIDALGKSQKLLEAPTTNLYPMVRVNNSIFMFSHDDDTAFELNIQNENATRKQIFHVGKLKRGFWRSVEAISTDGINVFVCIGNSNYLVHTNTSFKNAEYKKLLLKKDDRNAILQSIKRDIKKRTRVKEGICISLFDVIEFTDRFKLCKADEKIGSKIFNRFKKGIQIS